MISKTREIRQFFYSQPFADGFRSTVAILLPALIGSYLGHFDLGIAAATGALCANLADPPGPIRHKKNAMLICCLCIFVVSISTSYARLNIITMGLEIAIVCFFFTMFNVYGARAAAIGNASIIAMVLTMDKVYPGPEKLWHGLLVLSGGLIYTLLSLLFNTLKPYRFAQRALGESIKETAKYLSIRAEFYNVSTDLEANYRKLVAQQIVVGEKQAAARELLFKTRQIVRESTPIGRKLVLAFVDTVDLLEDITATYYDYAAIRSRFDKTGILEKISVLLHEIARELERLGFAVEANVSYQSTINFDDKLVALKESVDNEARTEGTSNLVLKKILISFRRLLQRVHDINYYFSEEDNRKRTGQDHSRFVGHQSLELSLFRNNLNLKSSIFRHSLRMTLACLSAFIIVKLIAYGPHSYWVLMTIAFMIRPAFSLTKARNRQRVLGTIAGGIVGVLILAFIPNPKIEFVFIVIFMLGTYSFLRTNYLVAVFCTTPYILILFKFLGVDFVHVAGERILDTVIGCVIASAASYFLFPNWEAAGLKKHMRAMLKANAHYLEKIAEGLRGLKINQLDYRLIRKDVYISSANLAAAFHRMLSEPKSKQTNEKQVHQFVVLNNILFSNIATLAATILSREARPHPHHLFQIAKKSLVLLNDSINKLGSHDESLAWLKKSEALLPVTENTETAEEPLLKEQLDFIYRLSVDIDKTTAELIAVKTSEPPARNPEDPTR